MPEGRLLTLLIIPAFISISIGYYGVNFLFGKARLLGGPSEVPTLSIPQVSLENTDNLKKALNIITKLDFEPKVVQEEEQLQEREITYELRFVFVGKRERYAIINGKLVREGEKLYEGVRVLKITPDGVLLSGKGGRRWVYLID
ncbi:MAG: general secretion pathway protein GspB [Aquificae bacterium]|nr:general secretion pathway protein GspB [Aquificota bacterium]